MKENLHERIVDWNRERNHLAFDPQLETTMLSEEAHEFWMATDLAHMIQEYTDFRFVQIGSRAKFYAQKFSSADGLVNNYDRWMDFESWMENTMDLMRKRVQRRLRDIGIYPPSDIFTKALQFVTEANEAKGKERVNGKVVKGPDYVSPLERIREELCHLQRYSREHTPSYSIPMEED